MESELTQPAVFEFAMIKATSEGFIHPNAEWTTIRMSPGTTPVVRMWMAVSTYNIAVSEPVNGVRDVDWSLSFNDMDTDDVLIRTSTEGVATSTYVHATPVEIRSQYIVFIDEMTSNFSTQGGDDVAQGEVLQGGST